MLIIKKYIAYMYRNRPLQKSGLIFYGCHKTIKDYVIGVRSTSTEQYMEGSRK